MTAVLSPFLISIPFSSKTKRICLVFLFGLPDLSILSLSNPIFLLIGFLDFQVSNKCDVTGWKMKCVSFCCLSFPSSRVTHEDQALDRRVIHFERESQMNLSLSLCDGSVSFPFLTPAKSFPWDEMISSFELTSFLRRFLLLLSLWLAVYVGN